jgi:hypothetical protein
LSLFLNEPELEDAVMSPFGALRTVRALAEASGAKASSATVRPAAANRKAFLRIPMGPPDRAGACR